MPTSARMVAVAAHGLAGSRTDLPHEPLSEVEWFDLVQGCVAADLVGLLAAAAADGHLPVTAGQAEELDVLAAEHAGLSALVERHAVTMAALLEIAGIDHRIVDGPARALAYPGGPGHSVRPVRRVLVLVPPARRDDARALQGVRPAIPDGPVPRHERLVVVDTLPGLDPAPRADLPGAARWPRPGRPRRAVGAGPHARPAARRGVRRPLHRARAVARRPPRRRPALPRRRPRRTRHAPPGRPARGVRRAGRRRGAGLDVVRPRRQDRAVGLGAAPGDAAGRPHRRSHPVAERPAGPGPAGPRAPHARPGARRRCRGRGVHPRGCALAVRRPAPPSPRPPRGPAGRTVRPGDSHDSPRPAGWHAGLSRRLAVLPTCQAAARAGHGPSRALVRARRAHQRAAGPSVRGRGGRAPGRAPRGGGRLVHRRAHARVPGAVAARHRGRDAQLHVLGHRARRALGRCGAPLRRVRDRHVPDRRGRCRRPARRGVAADRHARVRLAVHARGRRGAGPGPRSPRRVRRRPRLRRHRATAGRSARSATPRCSASAPPSR